MQKLSTKQCIDEFRLLAKDGACERWTELSEDEFNELKCQSKK